MCFCAWKARSKMRPRRQWPERCQACRGPPRSQLSAQACGDSGLEPGLLTRQRECPSQHERAPHQLLGLCYDGSHFIGTAPEASAGRWSWEAAVAGPSLISGPSDQSPCPGRHSPAHGWCCGRRRILRSQRRDRPPGRGEQRGWGLAKRVYQRVPPLPNREPLHAGTGGTPSSSPEWPCL